MKELYNDRKQAPDKGRPEELAIPCRFAGAERRRGEGIKIGDRVGILGLSKRYRLIEVFPEYQSVRVQELDGPRGIFMYLPWKFLRPCPQKPALKSKPLTQALGDALFRGSHVYKADEPDRVLMVRKINWDRQTSEVEDEKGRISELHWDETEFWEN